MNSDNDDNRKHVENFVLFALASMSEIRIASKIRSSVHN